MRGPAMAAALLFAPTAALAQVPPDLAREAREYERAQIEGDRAALERLIADDYVLVGGDGSRTDKGAHIAEFTAPEMDLQPVVVRDPVEHVWTDGAALGGTVDVVGTYGGTPFRQTLRYIDIWALRDGEWRVVYGQATRVPAAD
ncbi:nuclear transport factor 2 family protein [Brevundimonas sp.]|uniref:nuclear transport factor 2 family protein n=1 Tax=Brevundimonas sp. TaxID=1871086 RepID=UPI002737B0F5|nr:nuclear transport factor 2 family protein [Brevundimonas sp.]MDP3803847.1 nuclear transport factor 2 family protein [Brevundimonas sp.]